jgi:dCTP deaminase
MSILTGSQIIHEITRGHISITPFNNNQINPISYDLTLGNTVRMYSQLDGGELSVDKVNRVVEIDICPRGVLLMPGYGYLMHTRERIWTDRYAPIIDGKSSIGRLFLWVHVTAGFGDPGFDGQYTLEVVPLYHIRLYSGMRIAQIRFQTLEGHINQYCGHYTGPNAMGAVESKNLELK